MNGHHLRATGMTAWRAALGCWKCDRLAMSASPAPEGSGAQVTVLSLNRSCSTAVQPGPILAWASLGSHLPRPQPVCPGTCVHPIVRLQLVLEAELLAAAVALIGLLARVDALVALECALVAEAAATELTLVRVVACGDKGLHQALAAAHPLFRGH